MNELFGSRKYDMNHIAWSWLVSCNKILLKYLLTLKKYTPYLPEPSLATGEFSPVLIPLWLWS